MTISRRGALIGASAAALAVVGVPASAAQPDPLLEGVQSLVNEIRQELPGNAMAAVHWALHEAADRLEALPGITPVPNESWNNKSADFYRQKWVIRAVRPVGEARS